MNPLCWMRHVHTIAALTLVFSSGCGANGILPGSQGAGSSPAGLKPAGAGVVAVSPAAPATPAASSGAAAAPKKVPDAYWIEAEKSISAAREQSAKSKAEADRMLAAAAAIQAELAAEAEDMDHEPTPEERAEDRRLHPPSQVWTVLNNLKITHTPPDLPTAHVDYKLAAGSPRRYGFYELRVYLLRPDEKQISEDTMMSRHGVRLDDKTGGSLKVRLFELGTQDSKQFRPVAVLVQGMMTKHYELGSYAISGFLTTEMQSTAADPPALPAAQVGAEAQGKIVVLAPPQPWGRIPLVVNLNATYEFQIFEEQSAVNRYRMVVKPANGGGLLIDVTRDITRAEPFIRTPIHLREGPFQRALDRPIRIYIERLPESSTEWEAVSNVITQQ